MAPSHLFLHFLLLCLSLLTDASPHHPYHPQPQPHQQGPPDSYDFPTSSVSAPTPGSVVTPASISTITPLSYIDTTFSTTTSSPDSSTSLFCVTRYEVTQTRQSYLPSPQTSTVLTKLGSMSLFLTHRLGLYTMWERINRPQLPYLQHQPSMWTNHTYRDLNR